MSGLKDITKTPLAGRLRQSKNKSISKTGLLQEGKETKTTKTTQGRLKSRISEPLGY